MDDGEVGERRPPRGGHRPAPGAALDRGVAAAEAWRGGFRCNPAREGARGGWGCPGNGVGWAPGWNRIPLPPSQSNLLARSVLQADFIRGLEIHGATEAGLKAQEIGELGLSPCLPPGALPSTAS